MKIDPVDTHPHPAAVRKVRKAVALTRLLRQNRLSSAPVLADDGPVVSLTTFGKRFAAVHLTIESIASGRLRPSRLILWLDDADQVDAPTPGIARLIDRGLEVRLTEDLGPHKKYFPYVQSIRSHSAPLVTADDDWMYPTDWLESLMGAHAEDPTTNTAHRIRRIVTENAAIAPYRSWTLSNSTRPSPRHVATGCWGHVIVPRALDALRDRQSEFLDAAPAADDIWLHRVAVQTGTAPAGTGRYAEREMMHLPLRGAPTLSSANVEGAGNDRQIATAWTPEVVAAIVAAD